MHANPSFQSQYLSVEKHTDHDIDRMVMIVITIRLDSDDHENDDNVGHKYIMSLAPKDLRIISILRIIAIILLKRLFERGDQRTFQIFA